MRQSTRKIMLTMWAIVILIGLVPIYFIEMSLPDCTSGQRTDEFIKGDTHYIECKEKSSTYTYKSVLGNRIIENTVTEGGWTHIEEYPVSWGNSREGSILFSIAAIIVIISVWMFLGVLFADVDKVN